MCNKLHNICILSGKDFPQDLPVLRQHAVKLKRGKNEKNNYVSNLCHWLIWVSTVFTRSTNKILIKFDAQNVQTLKFMKFC